MHLEHLSPRFNPTNCQPTALECAQLAVCLARMPQCAEFVARAQAQGHVRFAKWHPHALLWHAYTAALLHAMLSPEDCADGTAAQSVPECFAAYPAEGLLALLEF